MGAPAIDTQQPLSVLLREGTKGAHKKAESSAGVAWLLRGALDRDEYVRFLMVLWHVYDLLEREIEKHASNPVLAPTYNPPLLGRAPRLSADISTLLGVPEAAWPTHPIHTDLLADTPAPLRAYAAHLRVLAGARPALLLAHAYVRYLGDMSGGQVVRRHVTKTFGLDERGAGVEFYAFGSLAGARVGAAGDLLKLKAWFRDGMDAGAAADPALKQELVQEANVAFDFNTALFTAIRLPKSPPTLVTPPTPPPSDPPTPTSATPPMSSSPPASPIERALPREIPIEIEHAPPAPDAGYSVASVAAVILAVGLAHFVLVTGKWVGTGGWLSTVFPEHLG